MELENVKQEELQLELEHHKRSSMRSSYKPTDLALNSPAESTSSSGDLSKCSSNTTSRFFSLLLKIR